VTLFQVTVGYPWPEELPTVREDGTTDWEVAGFMICFTIIVIWVILQASRGAECGQLGHEGISTQMYGIELMVSRGKPRIWHDRVTGAFSLLRMIWAYDAGCRYEYEKAKYSSLSF
jgi:preprotein translocase subunit SecG